MRRGPGTRRRFALATALAIAGVVVAVAIAPLVAEGAIGLFDYNGQIVGDPTSEIGFNVERGANGHRKVGAFTTNGLAYTCASDPAGETDALALDEVFRVNRDGEFGGTTTLVVSSQDPTARLHGQLRRHGRARGTIRITGELADPGSDCDTGRQDWRAFRGALG